MKKKLSLEKQYKLHIVSLISLLVAVIGLIAVTRAWFFNRRELQTLTWIKTPIILTIGSGNNHDIAYLDMGNIDASMGNSADYVFCVYGEPADIYSLQLAYTTNIAFSYDVYRADIATVQDSEVVAFHYTKDDVEYEEQFVKRGTPVIAGKPLSKMTAEEIGDHQSHRLSYGDDRGQNPVDKSRVQSNAQPLYWLAAENDINAMNPVNVGKNPDGSQYFCDYYVIHISWDEGAVVNDKETDMVYLTASR